MLWKKLGFTVGILCASIGTSGVASAEDKDFLAAREAYRVSDLVALSEYSTKLQGDIFAVYADYYLLSRQLDKVDPIAVITFLQKYPDTWLAEKLRGASLSTRQPLKLKETAGGKKYKAIIPAISANKAVRISVVCRP